MERSIKGRPRRTSRVLYWEAMSAGERKLSDELLGGVDFASELGFLRLRILRLAKGADLEGEKGFDKVRLMLCALDVLARFGKRQARLTAAGGGGASRQSGEPTRCTMPSGSM